MAIYLAISYLSLIVYLGTSWYVTTTPSSSDPEMSVALDITKLKSAITRRVSLVSIYLSSLGGVDSLVVAAIAIVVVIVVVLVVRMIIFLLMV